MIQKILFFLYILSLIVVVVILSIVVIDMANPIKKLMNAQGIMRFFKTIVLLFGTLFLPGVLLLAYVPSYFKKLKKKQSTLNYELVSMLIALFLIQIYFHLLLF